MNKKICLVRMVFIYVVAVILSLCSTVNFVRLVADQKRTFFPFAFRFATNASFLRSQSFMT